MHKLNLDEIKPGVDLPFRLVTALNNGPTSRADKFIAHNFLSGLAWDYCKDSLQDTTMFLQELDRVESSVDIGASDFLFNCDIEALYDSLKRDCVDKAMRTAIKVCRSSWSPDFVEWLMFSIHLSLDSAMAQFDGRWYNTEDGVPTGGKLCVYVANITVYFAFNEAIYAVYTPNLLFMKRFIDDGIGCWTGSLIEFYRWFCRIYKCLSRVYNLKLTYKISPANQYIEFLDVQFCFIDGVLDTDIYYKPTDAHRYLDYNSYHPSHVQICSS